MLVGLLKEGKYDLDCIYIPMIIQCTSSYIQYTTRVSLILDKYQLSVRNIALGYKEKASMFFIVLRDNVLIQFPEKTTKTRIIQFVVLLDNTCLVNN